MGGTYYDVDLNTIAGRDVELRAVEYRYDEGWMDMWRTDTYTAPEKPLPDTFAGVTNFLYIMDRMMATRPGFRYENCANGGHFKGLALAQRFTFVTTNDQCCDGGKSYRQTQWVNSHAINSVQLKSDVQVQGHNETYMFRTSMLGAWLLAMDPDADILHNRGYREHIALYKTRQRPILRGGDVYHILPMPDGVNWDGMQFFNAALNKGSVMLFKPSTAALDGDTKLIMLKGLERGASYRLSFQDRTALDTVKDGAELMDAGLM